MPYKDKEKNREYQREWGRKNRAKRREYNRSLRLKALKILGNECIYCGCNIPEVLEINHKNGGGSEERKRGKGWSKGLYLDIISGRRGKEEFELTCRICNSWHYLTKIKNVPDNWTILFHK